jgi:hypothetical protein
MERAPSQLLAEKPLSVVGSTFTRSTEQERERETPSISIFPSMFGPLSSTPCVLFGRVHMFVLKPSRSKHKKLLS